MEHETIYVAGGLYSEPYGSPAEFKLVKAGHGDDRPYLTRKKNGLQLTRHHAHLYAVAPDLSKLFLVDYREGVGRNQVVTLTKDQQDMIRQSIETNYFFD